MHREFLKLLNTAIGRSEYVIAINLDIRSFTPFCQTVDSMDVATYLKKIYISIINTYFKNASFYKPTGDGLFIIIPYEEKNLKEIANASINSCLALLESFGSLCNREPMITYSTPQKIGIGLSRGSACCIHSGDKILDYSGRILNLASRLMEMARPSGVVFDKSFGINLLSKENKELFTEESVYVRGVAEKKLKVYYTTRHTLLSDSYKQPFKEPKWHTDKTTWIFRDLKSALKRTEIKLSQRPLNEEKITVRITHDDLNNPKFYVFYEYHEIGKKFNVKKVGKVYYVILKIPRIVKELREVGKVLDDTKIKIDLIYPVE